MHWLAFVVALGSFTTGFDRIALVQERTARERAMGSRVESRVVSVPPPAKSPRPLTAKERRELRDAVDRLIASGGGLINLDANR